MENIAIVARQVAVLFVLMGAGFLARRMKILGDAAMEGFANLLMMVVTPCLIIDCFQRPFDPQMLGGLAIAFAIASVGHFAAIAMAYALVRHREEDVRRPLALAAVFSNAGFMGIPLEQAILGDEGVFYGVAYIVVFNLFMWSWGLRTMKGAGDGSRGAEVRKMVLNPGTIGISVGLPVFLFSIKMPFVVAAPLHHIANLNTPLAMIVVGYSLAGAKLGRVARMPQAYVTIAIRLVVYPLLVIAAMYPFRGILDRNMMLAMSIAAAAPVAAMVSMFAVKFRRDVETSVAVVSASTLLSILTIPAVVALALALFAPC